jgi:hypothetical protein
VAKTKRRLAKTVARGYGPAHRKLRERWAPLVERGDVVCARCQFVILPGQAWDLGHVDVVVAANRALEPGVRHEQTSE